MTETKWNELRSWISSSIRRVESLSNRYPQNSFTYDREIQALDDVLYQMQKLDKQ